jgi:hypothetical protein
VGTDNKYRGMSSLSASKTWIRVLGSRSLSAGRGTRSINIQTAEADEANCGSGSSAREGGGAGIPEKAGPGKAKGSRQSWRRRRGTSPYSRGSCTRSTRGARAGGERGAMEGANRMAAPGLPPCQDGSVPILVGQRKEAGDSPAAAAAAAATAYPGPPPPRAPADRRGPGLSLPGRQGAGPDHRGRWERWERSGPGLGRPTLQGFQVEDSLGLGFRGRRRLPGHARLERDARRRPPTQRSPGRRHQPEQRRTGAGNAPRIGQA